MADATPLDRYTEKQILNITTPNQTKGLEINFTPAGTEKECAFENPTGFLEIYSPIALWLSFTETGTGSTGSQRMYISPLEWNRIAQGLFVENVYILNFTAAQTGVVHFRYRD